MSSSGPKLDGGGGGGTLGAFLIPSLESIQEKFREGFDWQDYSRVGAGGLVAWAALAEDLVASGLGALGFGVMTAIASVGNANVTLLRGVANFFAALVTEATATTAMTTAVATATAELQDAGVIAFVLAIGEVIVILWLTRKAWAVVRS